MIFGLLTADAVVNAETVAVQIDVPAAVARTGYTENVVERIFVHEIETITQTRSLLQSPSMRSSRKPTIVGVIANSLRIDNFTAALQDLLGLDRTRIAGAIVTSAAGDRERLLINSSSAYSGAFSLEISEKGDTEQLLRHAAHDTMQRVHPYRSALFHFEQISASGGKDYSIVVQIAERELSRPLRAEMLEERSFLQNLLGIVALLNNDLNEAERRFRLSFDRSPGFNVGRINLAFVHVQRDSYQEAIDLLTPLIAGGLGQRLSIPSKRSALLQEAILNTLGTALWAQGDLDGAEAAYKRATREHPSSAGAYSYWARLLRERGDEQAAAEKEKIARVNALTFENYPEIANLYFWMSPRDNQPLVRRTDVPALTR
jgi:tetratricopeptide (TPR) repeat protein